MASTHDDDPRHSGLAPLRLPRPAGAGVSGRGLKHEDKWVLRSDHDLSPVREKSYTSHSTSEVSAYRSTGTTASDNMRALPVAHSGGSTTETTSLLKGSVRSLDDVKDLPDAMSRTVCWWVEMLVIIAGASLVSLVSGTPNAFNALSHDVMVATHTTPLFISTVTGVGVAGLFLTLPAGVFADTYGTAAAGIVGGVGIVGGFFSMSYVGHVPIVFALSYTLVGIGSGATFLSALSTAISLGNAWGIGLVSLCMSLSISFTIVVVNLYKSTAGCYQPQCWVKDVRLLGVVCGACVAVGSIGLALSKKHTARPPGGRASRGLSMDGEITFWQSTRILRRSGFWFLFVANMAGIGGGVFIVSSVQQVWTNFDSQQRDQVWSQRIAMLFSVFNATGNVLAPVLSDRLHRKGKLRRIHFTAGMLLLMCFVYLALGVFTVVPTIREGPWSVKLAYVVLMSSAGLGYGTSLTLFPTILADVYGTRNFATYMSYLQLGSALIAIAVPSVTAAVFNRFHYYSPMHFTMAVLLLFGALALLLPKFKSRTYGSLKGGGTDDVGVLVDRGWQTLP